MPEFVQEEATGEAVAAAAQALLPPEAGGAAPAIAALRAAYGRLGAMLGAPGVADRAAAHVLREAMEAAGRRREDGDSGAP